MGRPSHCLSPHYVQIYPFNHLADLLSNTKQLLADEANFVAQNCERLKKLLFFKGDLTYKKANLGSVKNQIYGFDNSYFVS